MPNRKRTFALIVVLSLMLLTVLSAVAIAGQAPPPANKEFDVVARQFALDPNIIRVNLGDNVTLRFSTTDVTHGIYIDGYDIKRTFLPGEEVEVNFIADRVGKFKIRCSVSCGIHHPYMIGELIVEPNYVFMGSTSLVVLLSAAYVGYLWVKKGR